eukprot:scaffold5.g729.t1
MSIQALLIAARDDRADLIGQTALHVAALQGSLRAAGELLDLGCDPNVQNRFGQTPLHFAARAHAHVREMCELLVEAGAESTPDDQGRVPYELADDDALRALLGGPDPRLFALARAGDAAGLRQLLADSPELEVDCFGGDGLAPIHLAAQGGHLPAVALLLAAGGFVDMQARPREAGHGRARLGAGGRGRSMPQGNSALHWAVEKGHTQLVSLLLEQGANPSLQNFSANEYAQGSWLVRGEVLQPLHQTPLHLAVEAGDAEIAERLLRAGADIAIADWDGKTALHCALDAQDSVSPLHQAAGCFAAAVPWLLEHGAEADTPDEQGWTPLMLAVRGGKAAAVSALLAAGASPALQNAQGNCALHLAAINGRPTVARLVAAALAAAGPSAAAAAVGLRNGAGQTPLEAAKAPDVAEVIRQELGLD